MMNFTKSISYINSTNYWKQFFSQIHIFLFWLNVWQISQFTILTKYFMLFLPFTHWRSTHDLRHFNIILSISHIDIIAIIEWVGGFRTSLFRKYCCIMAYHRLWSCVSLLLASLSPYFLKYLYHGESNW